MRDETMGSAVLAAHKGEIKGEQPHLETRNSSERIAETLEHILRSPRFKDSQQLQNLLRYVVDEGLKGNDDALKERMIGIYVFGRRPDYDTTDDPIVRSRMGSLRKRLVQYYEGQAGNDAGVQIVIPNGTYRPAFLFRAVPRSKSADAVLVEGRSSRLTSSEATKPVATLDTSPVIVPAPAVSLTSSHSVSRKTWGYRAGAFALVTAIVLFAAWCFFLRPVSVLDALWAPIVKGKQPIYVYTGTMTVYEPGSPTDEASSETDLYWPIRVPEPPSADLPKEGPNQVYSYGEGMLTGSVYADIRVSAFLNKYDRTPVLRSGANLPYMDLKGSPLILIGSFDNYWTRVMNENLPFYFDRGFGIRERGGAQRRWHNPLKAEMTPRMMEDYALIFRVMDSKAGAPVLAIAGLSTCGTHAAADFVTDPAQLQGLQDLPRAALLTKNFELVLHATLVNCAPTSVEVVASKVW